MLAADLGPRTTNQILEAVRQKLERHALGSAADLKSELKNQLLYALRTVPLPTSKSGAALAAQEPRPRVIFVVGVNGTGKTTTIGKLAHRLHQDGKKVVLAAGDTFRAAAIEQLGVWAARTGSEIVKTKSGGDPAAVVYDALSSARSRNADVVIVDTAGRLHNKLNLMAELDKMKRTASKIIPGAPHVVLLVMDATTGQNGLSQAREFTATAGVTGIVLTKLDGTAKGGIVVAITRELGLPVQYVGTGAEHPGHFEASIGRPESLLVSCIPVACVSRIVPSCVASRVGVRARCDRRPAPLRVRNKSSGRRERCLVDRYRQGCLWTPRRDRP